MCDGKAVLNHVEDALDMAASLPFETIEKF